MWTSTLRLVGRLRRPRPLRDGKLLDGQPDGRNGIGLACKHLYIRDRSGARKAMDANPVQARFERGAAPKNIVVKARQMGMTTWIAGRFFLKTITACGVLTVQVAQTREAARVDLPHRAALLGESPGGLRKGPLKRSRANVGQMVFPRWTREFRVLTASDGTAGRGLTVQNMHLSEVSRWPGDAAGPRRTARRTRSRRRNGARKHAQRRLRLLLRGVAAGRGEGCSEAFFPLVARTRICIRRGCRFLRRRALTDERAAPDRLPRSAFAARCSPATVPCTRRSSPKTPSSASSPPATAASIWTRSRRA